jgi:hypothetical protein
LPAIQPYPKLSEVSIPLKSKQERERGNACENIERKALKNTCNPIFKKQELDIKESKPLKMGQLMKLSIQDHFQSIQADYFLAFQITLDFEKQIN